MGVKQAQRFFLVLCLMGVPWWLPGQTPAAATGGKPISEAAHISLDGSWKLFYFPQAKYHITNPDQLKTRGLTAIEASVPGETPLDCRARGYCPPTFSLAKTSRS